MKFVRGPGYDTYKPKKVNKEDRKDATVDKEIEEEQEAPVPLVNQINNILHSVSLEYCAVHQQSANLQL